MAAMSRFAACRRAAACLAAALLPFLTTCTLVRPRPAAPPPIVIAPLPDEDTTVPPPIIELPFPEEVVTVALVGDIQLMDVDPSIPAGERHSSFRPVLDMLRRADLAVANLECALSATGTRADKAFTFRAAPSRTADLRTMGIDAVSLANNHVLDFGASALLETLAALDSAGIAHAGAGRDLAAARRPVLITVKGVRIALLSYSSITAMFFATERRPGTAPLDEATLAADIRRAAAQADQVIVSLHWGREGSDVPDDTMQRVTRLAFDAGATIVHGHHPHRMMGFARDDSGVAAYSLGNFLFGHSGRGWPESAILLVTLDRHRVREARVVPLRDDRSVEECFLAVPPSPAQARAMLAQFDLLSERFGARIDEQGALTRRTSGP